MNVPPVISATVVPVTQSIKSAPPPNAADASGTVTIQIPAGVVLDENTQLMVFNEQFNGDYMTGYASALRDVATDIPKTGDSATPALWLGILLMAGAALATSVVFFRKRQEG